jgi:ABC-2 type transport system ATP-binding protein/lipopolysaccharide transport system ATP-binding protein
MARIELENVTIDFPIYTPRDRSIRANIAQRIGGKIASDARNENSTVVRAIDNVSLRLAAGDRLGLVGSNGAGKSTLLRAMSRVYEPTNGRLVVEGRTSSLLDIALGMDLDLTGYENIRLRGVFMGMTTRQIRAEVADIEAFCQLGRFLELPVRIYSSGMMLRLAFAISTSNDPDIVLLDELIGVGDVDFRAKSRERLDRIIEGAHVLVMASHDENLLRTYCTKGALMSQGRVVALGSIDDILAQYAD